MKRTVVLAAGILLLAGTALPTPATSSGFDRGKAAIVAPVHPCFGPRFGRSVRPAFVAGRPLSFCVTGECDRCADSPESDNDRHPAADDEALRVRGGQVDVRTGSGSFGRRRWALSR